MNACNIFYPIVIFIISIIVIKNVQIEKQQSENIKVLHKKEITNKEECIKKLQEKSISEENKKIIEIQNEFEKKIKSKYDYKIYLQFK